MDKRCPAWLEATKDTQLVQNIMQLREQLGFTDNEIWRQELEAASKSWSVSGIKLFP